MDTIYVHNKSVFYLISVVTCDLWSCVIVREYVPDFDVESVYRIAPASSNDYAKSPSTPIHTRVSTDSLSSARQSEATRRRRHDDDLRTLVCITNHCPGSCSSVLCHHLPHWPPLLLFPGKRTSVSSMCHSCVYIAQIDKYLRYYLNFCNKSGSFKQC